MDKVYKVNCFEVNKPKDIMGLTPIIDTSHDKWKEQVDIKTLTQELGDILNTVEQ